jgi:hypothetical protein
LVKTVRFLARPRADLGEVIEIVPAIDDAELTDLVHAFEQRAGMETWSTSYGGLNTWDYGVEKWDLVVLTYASGNDAAIRKALKPGGLVVGEWFHKDAVPSIGTDTAEVAALFKDGFSVLRNDVIEDVSDWGWKERVPQKLIRFAAEKR